MQKKMFHASGFHPGKKHKGKVEGMFSTSLRKPKKSRGQIKNQEKNPEKLKTKKHHSKRDKKTIDSDSSFKTKSDCSFPKGKLRKHGKQLTDWLFDIIEQENAGYTVDPYDVILAMAKFIGKQDDRMIEAFKKHMKNYLKIIESWTSSIGENES